MDGRRRLVEPVTDGVPTRPAAGVAPGSWRVRARIFMPSGLDLGSGKPARALRRCIWAAQNWRFPRGAGIAAEFEQIVEDYIERRFGATKSAAE